MSISHPSAFLARGFRPFFFLAAAFAALAMLVWTLQLTQALTMPLAVPPISWHAHEMIYGYSMAVIAGFLLTAVQNWTQVPTWSGGRLLVLAAAWCLPRILMVFGGPSALPTAAAADCAFHALLLWAIAAPIVKVKQWRQLGVLVILTALLVGNIRYYQGALYGNMLTVNQGIYGGLYLIIGMILLIGWRVIPFFTGSRVPAPYQPHRSIALARVSAALFAAFIMAELIWPAPKIAAGLAGILAIVLTLTLAGWYAKGIWARPLLWILYLAYAAVIIGFAMHAVAAVTPIAPALATHAFAIGGIGLITVGMMARVSLGHTGRNIDTPPPVTLWAFILLIVAGLIRVALPAMVPSGYLMWIQSAQICWITAFVLFLISFSPLLWRARPDGQAG